MAEIQLICPGCAAEYRIPDTAIPPEGREVECSACGDIWFAAPAPARPAAADPLPSAVADTPPDLPRLNRRLPDTVLDILRDEVEHERRARATEGRTGTPDPDPAGQRLAVDPEWPATTITRHHDPSPAERSPAHPSELRPEPAEAPVAATPAPEPEPAAPAKGIQDKPTVAPVEPALPVPPRPVPPLARPRRGYGAGFGLAAALAAVLVALYVLAPSLGDDGAFGDRVMSLRAQADDARLWLQDRATALTR